MVRLWPPHRFLNKAIRSNESALADKVLYRTDSGGGPAISSSASGGGPAISSSASGGWPCYQ